MHMQVCVSECPTANEFGVRDNPVCVDSVDTSRFVNVTNAVSFTAADNIAVSLFLSPPPSLSPPPPSPPLYIVLSISIQ